MNMALLYKGYTAAMRAYTYFTSQKPFQSLAKIDSKYLRKDYQLEYVSCISRFITERFTDILLCMPSYLPVEKEHIQCIRT